MAGKRRVFGAACKAKVALAAPDASVRLHDGPHVREPLALEHLARHGSYG
jgi:hypothetical protein